jgi:hypothetical protein
MTYQRESTNHSFIMRKLSMDLVNLHVFRISKKKKYCQIATEEDKFDAIHRITVKQFAPV